MRVIWIVTANASLVKIYEATKLDHHIKLAMVEERYHPESRLKETELKSDGEGSYQAGQTMRSTYSPRSFRKDIEAEHFAREIVAILEQSKHEQRFNGLILSASLPFKAMLNDLLPHPLEEDVKHFLDKDYTDRTAKEIEEIFSPVYRPLLSSH